MTPRLLPIAHTIQVVATQFGVTPEDLLAKDDVEPMRSIRSTAILVARHATGKTYQEIAWSFGKRHHTTVISSTQLARQKTTKSEWFKRTVTELILRVIEDVNDTRGGLLFKVHGLPSVQLADADGLRPQLWDEQAADQSTDFLADRALQEPAVRA